MHEKKDILINLTELHQYYRFLTTNTTNPIKDIIIEKQLH